MPRACSSAEILQGDSEWSELEKVRDEKWKGGIDEYSRQSEEEENDHRTGRERYERWLGENFGSLASSSHPSRWVKTLSLSLSLSIYPSISPSSFFLILQTRDQGKRRPRDAPDPENWSQPVRHLVDFLQWGSWMPSLLHSWTYAVNDSQ